MQSDSKGHTVGSKVANASVIVGIAHLLFKVAGLLVAIVMARVVGKSVFEPVYVVAFEGCIFTIFLLGEEVIGPAFLPIFMRELDTGSQRSAWRFANTMMVLQLLVLFVVVATLMLFADRFILLWTTWDPAEHADKFSLASGALSRMAPALICLSIGSATYMLLNGYKRFFLAAFGDASWKFCLFFFVLLGMGVMGLDHGVIVAGLLVGSVAKLATHVLGLRDKLKYLRAGVDFKSPAMRRLALLMLPLIAGIVFARIRDIFNNVWILSRLEEGLMQASFFGRKIYQSLGWLVPYTISIAIFPFLCELEDRDDKKAFGEVISKSGRMLLSIFIPFSVVCLVAAHPLSELLFKGGKFTDEAVHLTAVSMGCQVLVLPAYALEYLLMQAFFAKRKMISVTVIGIVFSVLSMAISYVGLVTLGLTGAAALAAVALGFTVARTLKVVTLIVELKRTIPIFPLGETFGFLARTCLTGVLAAAAFWGAMTLVARVVTVGPGKLIVVLKLGAGGLAAAAAYVGATHLLRIREPATILNWCLARALRGRRG